MLAAARVVAESRLSRVCSVKEVYPVLIIIGDVSLL